MEHEMRRCTVEKDLTMTTTTTSTNKTKTAESYLIIINNFDIVFKLNSCCFEEERKYFSIRNFTFKTKVHKPGDFPGGPVVKTLNFHHRGHRFDP